jgi:hypothetical protein
MDNADLGLSQEKINRFKEWVQSQNKRPHIWDARRWFHGPSLDQDEPDASLDTALKLLIDEAIEDALKEMKDRNEVILILANLFQCRFFVYQYTRFVILCW